MINASHLKTTSLTIFRQGLKIIHWQCMSRLAIINGDGEGWGTGVFEEVITSINLKLFGRCLFKKYFATSKQLVGKFGEVFYLWLLFRRKTSHMRRASCLYSHF